MTKQAPFKILFEGVAYPLDSCESGTGDGNLSNLTVALSMPPGPDAHGSMPEQPGMDSRVDGHYVQSVGGSEQDVSIGTGLTPRTFIKTVVV